MVLIDVTTELRWEARLLLVMSRLFLEDGVVSGGGHLLAAKDFDSGFRANISRSKASASNLVGSASNFAVLGSGRPLRNGTSMVASTSCSRRPNIWISCIFARATNLGQNHQLTVFAIQ